MDLNGSTATSMMNGGKPGTHAGVTGQSLFTTGPQGRGLNYDVDEDFMAAANVPANDYSNLWVGTLHVTAATAGVWQFRDSDRDDWSGIWVDRNQNGIFESTTPGLGSDRGEQLAYNDQNAKSVTLAAGDYLIAFTHLEGGGGSRMQFSYRSPLMGAEAVINPSDPTQAGLWSTTFTQGGLDISQGEVRTLNALNLGTLILSPGGWLNRTGGPAQRDITVTERLVVGQDLDMAHGETLTTVGADVTINSGSTLYINHPVNARNLDIQGNLVRSGSGAQANVTVTQSLTLNSDMDFTPGGGLTSAGADIVIGASGKLVVTSPLVANSVSTAGILTMPGANITKALNISGGTTTTSGNVTAAGLTGSGGTLVTEGTLTINPTAILGLGGQIRVDSGNLTLNVPTGGTQPPPGVQLHLDASALAGYSNGQTVTNWTDKSGAGHHANQVQSDPAYTTNVLNGLPVVRFDGDDWLRTTYNFDPLTNYTVLSVARYTGGDSERVISSNSRNWLFGFHGDGIERWHAEGWIYNNQVAGGNTAWQLHAGTMGPATNNPTASFWRNGTLLTSGNQGSGDANYMIGQLQLNGYGGGEISNADIAEVLIFNRVLTASELNSVGGYLASKYGLTTSYTGGLQPTLGDIRLADGASLTLTGAGQPKVNSIGATENGPIATGPMTLSNFGNPTAARAGSTVTIDSTITDATFNVTGPGTVALKQNLTIASGGTLGVASGATLASLNSLTIDASAATLSMAQGNLNVDAGALTVRMPAGGSGATFLPGAVSYWGLDGNALDGTGNGHDGTVQGTATWTGGVVGGAMSFNGATDISVPYSAAFGLSTYTISSWVNIAQEQTNGGILGTRFNGDQSFDLKVRGPASNDIHADVGSGGAWIDTNVDIQTAQGGDISLNAWHMVTYVIDDATKQFRLYLDGALARTIGYSGTPNLMPASRTMRLGNASGTEYLNNGLLDEMFVYGRALTTAEVLSLYQAGVAGSYGIAPSLGALTMANGTTLDLANSAGVSGAGAAAFESITTTGPTATILGSAELRGAMTLGASPGTLNVTGSFTMAAGSTYHWEHDGTNQDLVAVTGSVDVSSAWTLGITLGGAIANGSYDLFTHTMGSTPPVGAVNVIKENSYAQLISSAVVGSDNDSVFVTLNLVANSTWTSQASLGGTIDWHTASNWNSGVPTASMVAIVKDPAADQVATIFSGATGEAQSVIIDNGGHVQVNGGGTLQVGSGIYVENTGTLTLDQGSTLTVPLVRVNAGGTLEGPAWPPSRRATLDAATTVQLAGGAIAGNFNFTNPSTTAGSYALEVESGLGTGTVYGPGARSRGRSCSRC